MCGEKRKEGDFGETLANGKIEKCNWKLIIFLWYLKTFTVFTNINKSINISYYNRGNSALQAKLRN